MNCIKLNLSSENIVKEEAERIYELNNKEKLFRMPSSGPYVVTTIKTSQYLLAAPLGVSNTVYRQSWLEEEHLGLYPAELLTTDGFWERCVPIGESTPEYLQN